MTYLGLGPKKRGSLHQGVQQKGSSIIPNGTNEEAKRLAAAALSAVKDAAAAASGRGKVEVCSLYYSYCNMLPFLNPSIYACVVFGFWLWSM